MRDWSKSRILFLVVGVVLVGIGAWLILPSLTG
jgi:hypothetical protein